MLDCANPENRVEPLADRSKPNRGFSGVMKSLAGLPFAALTVFAVTGGATLCELLNTRATLLTRQVAPVAFTHSACVCVTSLPAAPTLRFAPPRGEQWVHKVQFDGWRIRLHKHGRSAAAFTKNGHAHSSRVRWMIDALERLPGVRSLIIDGELVACAGAGVPHFYALHFHSRKYGLCVWTFDLLRHNGRDYGLQRVPAVDSYRGRHLCLWQPRKAVGETSPCRHAARKKATLRATRGPISAPAARDSL
jgi:hypothetical protein